MKTKPEKKEKNSVDINVEMFADMGADSVLVSRLEPDGLATIEPFDSKTGTSWAMMLMTSFDEVVESKYPKVVPNELVELYDKLEFKKAVKLQEKK